MSGAADWSGVRVPREEPPEELWTLKGTFEDTEGDQPVPLRSIGPGEAAASPGDQESLGRRSAN
eukprot:11123579-Lingulodinium_polyedra.AAC.1